MPSADRLLPALRQAAALVRATPGRVGHLVHLTGATELVVVGDLHGHVPNFQAVHKAADLASHPGRHLVLQELIHGPFRYGNGGDKSHQLVDLFAVLVGQFPGRVHYLPGNHELAQWTDRPVGKGDESFNAVYRRGLDAAYAAAGPAVYAAHCELWQALPLAIRTPNAVFVCHTVLPAKNQPLFSLRTLEQARFTDADRAAGGVVYGLLWGRDTSGPTVEAFLRKVDADLLVTGHIPTEAGFLAPNGRQLIVDCSATPAAYVRFPTDRPLTHAELVAGVVVV
jgi:hypothetical protein